MLSPDDPRKALRPTTGLMAHGDWRSGCEAIRRAPQVCDSCAEVQRTYRCVDEGTFCFATGALQPSLYSDDDSSSIECPWVLLIGLPSPTPSRSSMPFVPLPRWLRMRRECARMMAVHGGGGDGGRRRLPWPDLTTVDDGDQRWPAQAPHDVTRTPAEGWEEHQWPCPRRRRRNSA